MEIKCLQCGLSVPQTPGKRKKEYCGPTCRTTFWKKKKDAGKVKKAPGRPKKVVKNIDPAEIQAKIREAQEKFKDLPILRGVAPTIEDQIKAIREEKIPPNRDTPLGRKSWALDQKKRITELDNKLRQ